MAASASSLEKLSSCSTTGSGVDSRRAAASPSACRAWAPARPSESSAVPTTMISAPSARAAPAMAAASAARAVWRTVASGLAIRPPASDTASPKNLSPGSTARARTALAAPLNHHPNAERHPRHARVPFRLHVDLGPAAQGQGDGEPLLRALHGLTLHQL